MLLGGMMMISLLETRNLDTRGLNTQTSSIQPSCRMYLKVRNREQPRSKKRLRIRVIGTTWVLFHSIEMKTMMTELRAEEEALNITSLRH